MRRMGILFEMVIGPSSERKRYLCGWRNGIINYLTALARREEEAKRKEI